MRHSWIAAAERVNNYLKSTHTPSQPCLLERHALVFSPGAWGVLPKVWTSLFYTLHLTNSSRRRLLHSRFSLSPLPLLTRISKWFPFSIPLSASCGSIYSHTSPYLFVLICICVCNYLFISLHLNCSDSTFPLFSFTYLRLRISLRIPVFIFSYLSVSVSVGVSICLSIFVYLFPLSLSASLIHGGFAASYTQQESNTHVYCLPLYRYMVFVSNIQFTHSTDRWTEQMRMLEKINSHIYKELLAYTSSVSR